LRSFFFFKGPWFAVPLIDGGTVRLPRLIGQSRALDMILTGRSVSAQEAFDWGEISKLLFFFGGGFKTGFLRSGESSVRSRQSD
jgi:hypothetical protein